MRGSGDYDRKKKDTVFVLSMKGLSSTNWSPSPWFFFELGVMNDAAESNCILPIGDDGSLNGGCSSSEHIIIEINSER